MNRSLSFFLFSAPFYFCGMCAGYDDAMITPTGVLAESRFKKSVQITSDEHVYESVAALFDQPGTIEFRGTSVESEEVNLAWESNPAADKKTAVVKLAKGTTVLEALQQIASSRGERLTKSPNYIVITSPARLPARPTYRQTGNNPSADLESQLTAIIPPRGIFILQPEGDSLEGFINKKLQESWSLSKKGASPFSLKVSETAKKKVGTVNLIGTWMYDELFEAIGVITGLRWRIDGETVYLQK